MKAKYIKPEISASRTFVSPIMTAVLSNARTTTGAWDAQSIESNEIDVVNDASGSITMTGKERGGFGSESGPWESLW